jgi:anthranilate synthase component 1
MISFAEVKRLSQKGNVIPIFARIPADLDTPVAAFIKLASGKRESFLLESIEGGEKLARYSFIGFDPFLIIEGNSDSVTLRRGREKQKIAGRPVEFLKRLFAAYRPVKVQGLPRFTGGGVGYFSYDCIRWLERIPDANPDDIGLPAMRIGLFSHIVVFDHLKQDILVIANILHEPGRMHLKDAYDEAVAFVERTVKKLQTTIGYRKEEPSPAATVATDYSRSEFEKMVRRAKKYIKEGDIFQVVLSQRWRVSSTTTPLSVYRRLRRINPSPYMYLIRFGDNAIVGSSPEMLVRVEGREVETRPIAGTRPRGRNEREDEKRIADLLSDAKELAEHTMLLDLGRNDLGRVSETGSVTVKERMIIEKYSHVIHIVSSVTGRLKKRLSPLDALLACFPAGTVSGAPKIRAMEIIDELEKLRRGVYAGAVAYLDFWGNLDSCIAIRTVVKKGDTYYVQAGAGIVADSRPTREFRETEAKARALIQAVAGGEQP